MADKPHITQDGYVERLVQVGIWATPQNPIQYAFLQQHPSYLPNEPGWTVLSAAQRAGVEKAFAMIAEVVNLTFVEVADNQQQPGPGNPRINFYANTVELSYSGSMDAYQLDGSSAIHGADIRFNTSRIAQRQSNEGWQDFTSFVALHEVLHSMGLSHPGNYNGQGFNYQDDADFAEDTIQYSVMSYFSASNTGADHLIGNVLYGARTPLLYDILALQSLYAPNMTTRAGDTVYGFNSNTGATSPFNFAVTTGPVVAIWDGGGIDTIDLSGYGGASLIDLNEGAFSDAGGLTKNIAIAFNVTIENAVGGTGADRLIGNAVANRLDGGAGADQMEGGAGDDVYVVDDLGDVVVELAGGGADEVRTSLAAYVLAADLENLTGFGTAGQSLSGNALANVLTGGQGDDTLDGGAGPDQLAGGPGSDLYLVGAGDTVTEAANAGTDEVRTALAAYTLGANVERLTGLSASGQALTGNALSNLITGGAGNDVLAGGAGADQLAGGLGNDVYTMDGSDVATEAANAGTDEVRTALSAFTLGANFENLTGTSSTGQSLTGNGLANLIAGGAGADQFAGGLGNDLYVVGAGDNVGEAANAGTDEVMTALSAYALAANVERLTGISATGQALTGNALSNLIKGGAGNDVIAGGSGADQLAGGLGDDVYTMDSSDTIVEAANGGIDEVRTALAAYALGANVENLTGTSAAGQSLTGNGLANLLAGGSAADHFAGGLGNDVYLVGAGDIVTENAGEGIDEIRTGLAGYTLGANLENLTGTSAAQTLTGNDLANTIAGGLGADTLNGGLGNDSFLYRSAAEWTGDRVDGGGGSDTLSLSGAMGGSGLAFGNAGLSGVERILLGSAPAGGFNAYNLSFGGGNIAAGKTLLIDGSALRVGEGLGVNAFSETLGSLIVYGGASRDLLTGGAQADTFRGGLGGDYLKGNGGADRFVYSGAADSTGRGFDQLVGFDYRVDKIDLPGTVSGWAADVNTGRLAGATFDSDLAAALDAALGANQAVLFRPDSGDHAGRLFAVIDANGDGAYRAGQDYVLEFVAPPVAIAPVTSFFV